MRGLLVRDGRWRREDKEVLHMLIGVLDARMLGWHPIWGVSGVWKAPGVIVHARGPLES